MIVQRIAETSFVLVDAAWSPEKALALLERGHGATHVIVHRIEPGRGDGQRQQYFYLYPVGELVARLYHRAGARSVKVALDLHESQATPAVEVFAGAETAPDRYVVHDGGRPVGFVDLKRPIRRGVRRTRGVARANGDGGAAETEPLPRTLSAEFPQTVARDREEWLLVALAGAQDEDAGLGIGLPAGETIDVLVQGRKGFVVEGDTHGTLPVSEQDAIIRFRLRAVETGPGLIRVLAFHQARSLGALTVTPMVTDPAAAAPSPAIRDAQPVAPIKVSVPDLSMLIEEQSAGGHIAYTVRLTAPNPALGLNYRVFGPVALKVDPMAFFRDFFAEIEDLPLETAPQRQAAQRKLERRGTYLYQTLFTPDLRQELWRLRDSIRSVIVQSEEPWIPWELCKLYGEENGTVVEGPFLCEAFSVTRWIPGLRLRPVSVRNVALVVPSDSELPLAGAERDYVLSLAGGERTVEEVPANFLSVHDALASGRYDCWHFTGHGASLDQNPDRSQMLLEGDEVLTPEDISGVVTNLGRGSPLVFLNACQIGRAALSLTGIGGWARRFLEAGAASFVGAYWSVYDTPACDFSKEFYGGVLSGKPIGQAVQEARAAIKPAGDATWLAYVVYADPLAAVQSP